jgi:uncharacterized membrane protein
VKRGVYENLLFSLFCGLYCWRVFQRCSSITTVVVVVVVIIVLLVVVINDDTHDDDYYNILYIKT